MEWMTVLQLRLMCNALFSEKMRDDFKEMKKEIRIISDKLKSQMTSAEEGIDLMCWWRFYWTLPGVIIGEGDRKSWDLRRPMIWDNFSIFRTNCAILTSYIRAASRMCCGFSRVCCHVAWSKMMRVARFLADFSQRWKGIRQGRRTRALLWTFMLWVNGQGEFFGVENVFNFAIWMNNICSRRLLYA